MIGGEYGNDFVQLKLLIMLRWEFQTCIPFINGMVRGQCDDEILKIRISG